jgi:hypothetical protein
VDGMGNWNADEEVGEGVAAYNFTGENVTDYNAGVRTLRGFDVELTEVWGIA